MSGCLKDLITSADAFPKVDIGYLNPTISGGLTSIVAYSLIGFLSLSELFKYLFVPFVAHSLHVDKELQSDIRLLFDVSIASPCEQLVVASVDAGGQKNILNEFVTPLPIVLPGGVEGCRVKGNVVLNKVSGYLLIVPNASMLPGPFGAMLMLIDQRVNFSHQIHRFAFGPSANEKFSGSYFKNPLDGVVKISDNRHQRFSYELSVLPTQFVDGDGNVLLKTNQYAVKGLRTKIESVNSVLPGLYFEYDLDPMAVTIRSERLGFIWVLVNILGIIGGIYTCSGLIHHCCHHLYIYYISGRNAIRCYLGALDGQLPSGSSISYSKIRTADSYDEDDSVKKYTASSENKF